MRWWAWILFWVVFTVAATGYLAWRCWGLWPHLKDFGRAVQTALERADAARRTADDVRAGPTNAAASAESTSREVHTRTDTLALAWNQPASYWRAQVRRDRRRRRALRLDDHAQTWASWRRRVD